MGARCLFSRPEVGDLPGYVVQLRGRMVQFALYTVTLLRPCGFLSVNEIEDLGPSNVLHKPRTRSNAALEAADQEHSTSDQSESDDDSLYIRDSRRQLEFHYKCFTFFRKSRGCKELIWCGAY